MDLTELLEIAARENTAREPVQIRCCVAAGCLSSDSLAVKQRLEATVTAMGMEERVQVCGVGCMRLCCQGTLVQVGENILYEQVTSENAPAIITALNGEEATAQRGDLTMPFFTQQMPIVLENSGKIDPERIEAYITVQGYQALYQVLHEKSPNQVVDVISRSGLRGRGGAGYPTGLKWATVAKAKGDRKYVICNADEGDPGAFMDRSVLESDPHRVLEGMAIAAYPSFITLSRRKYKLGVELMHDGTHKPIHLTDESLKSKL